MAKSIEQLTEKKIRAIANPGLYADGRGLYLQIRHGGAKSWIFRFTRKGRTRDFLRSSRQCRHRQGVQLKEPSSEPRKRIHRIFVRGQHPAHRLSPGHVRPTEMVRSAWPRIPDIYFSSIRAAPVAGMCSRGVLSRSV
jgi:hypothetical protein